MWDKLKREWKTLAFALLTIAVGTYEAAVAAGYDLTPLLPDHWKPFAVPIIGITFLVLRQWRDKVNRESNK